MQGAPGNTTAGRDRVVHCVDIAARPDSRVNRVTADPSEQHLLVDTRMRLALKRPMFCDLAELQRMGGLQ